MARAPERSAQKGAAAERELDARTARPAQDADEAVADGVVPDGEAGTVAAPGVERLGVGARPSRDPSEQLEGWCGGGHVLS